MAGQRWCLETGVRSPVGACGQGTGCFVSSAGPPAMAGACFGGESVRNRALGAKSEKVGELLADKKPSLSRSCGECQKHLGGKSSTRSAFTLRRSVTCFGGSDVVRASGCRDRRRRQRGSVCGWKN